MADLQIEVLQPGLVFHGRYRVLRRIGAGGMGRIYEVLDSNTNSKWALKTMHPEIVSDREQRARFEFEAKVTGPIESDHLAKVTDAGVDEQTGLPYLVMELLRGEDLGCMLERGPLPFEQVVLLLGQVARALTLTHEANIVHRDLKPENLFVSKRDDGSLCVKILDFGIAKVVAQSTHAKTTRNVGTPLYMSPEQVLGDGTIGPRTDLYSLGHIAFALLTGKPYWEPESREINGTVAFLLRVMQGAPEAASVRAARCEVQLPADFDAWFSRATAREAWDRFDSALDMVKGLAKALGVPLRQPSQPSLPAPALPTGLADTKEAQTLPCEPAAQLGPKANPSPLRASDPYAKSMPPVSSTDPRKRSSRHRVTMTYAGGATLGLAIAIVLLFRLHVKPSTTDQNAAAGAAADAAHAQPPIRQGAGAAADAGQTTSFPVAADAGLSSVAASIANTGSPNGRQRNTIVTRESRPEGASQDHFSPKTGDQSSTSRKTPPDSHPVEDPTDTR